MAVDDLDHDGVRDYIVAMPALDNGLGLVRAMSALDGDAFWRTARPDARGSFVGYSVGDVGDIDGDGVSDFAYSSVGRSIVVMSGRTTTAIALPLLALPTSDAEIKAISSCGDLNKDQNRDFLVGCVTPSGRYVIAVSGNNGEILLRLRDDLLWERFGAPWSAWPVAAATATDANGDEIDDILVGFGPPRFGAMRAYRGVAALVCGRSGSVIRRMWSEGAGYDGFGHTVREVDDLDSDGVRDYAVASERGIAVYSGSTGDIVRRLYSNETCISFDVGRLDRGPLDDFLLYCVHSRAGRPFATGGSIELYSGEELRRLCVVDLSCRSQYGSACFVGDVDVDGFDDVLLATPSDVSRSRLTLLSGKRLVEHGRVSVGIDGCAAAAEDCSLE